MTAFRPDHPLARGDGFKLGVFAANADGGLAITTSANRWGASWEDNAAAARLADDAGLDFFLPIARWAGFGGKTRAREHSFETLTWAAALAATTSRIAIFATVHVPLVHPVYAAKALATIDHISGGRAGLNIVCGWNPTEFAMFGTAPDKKGYDRADEWLDIIERAYAADAPFDFNGEYYALKGVVSRPPSLQRPRPLTMNAAFGDPGRNFAARRCDVLFTTFTELADAGGHVADMTRRGEAAGRAIDVYTVGHVVCRDSLDEAQAFYDRYSLAEADQDAVDTYMAAKHDFSHNHDEDAYRLHAQRFAAGGGTYPLVGTPEMIAEDITAMARAGYKGAAFSFLNYTDEVERFAKGVLPLLEHAGVRSPVEGVPAGL